MYSLGRVKADEAEEATDEEFDTALDRGAL